MNFLFLYSFADSKFHFKYIYLSRGIHDGEIEQSDVNFSTIYHKEEYNCFYQNKIDERPKFLPTKIVLKSFYQKMKDKCHSFIYQLSTRFELCHFDSASITYNINNVSSTPNVIGEYDQEPLVFSNNHFFANWSNSEPETFIEIKYFCDITAPDEGRIVDADYSTKHYIHFQTPHLCDTEELWPSDITTVKCFSRMNYRRYILQKHGQSLFQ